MTYLNDPVLVNVVEHLVHDRRDNLLRPAGNGECDRGSVEIARESLSGEDGLPLEKVPFTFVLDQGNEISDQAHDQSLRRIKAINGGGRLTDHR